MKKYLDENKLIPNAKIEVDKHNGAVLINDYVVISITCNKEYTIKYYVDKTNCSECGVENMISLAESIIEKFAPTFQ